MWIWNWKLIPIKKIPIQDGQVWERAAVNISVVNGTLPSGAVSEMRARGKEAIPVGKDLPFFACGISSVIHPVIEIFQFRKINFSLRIKLL